MFSLAVASIFGYFIGAIPTAYLLARIVKGIDIRKVGSGNVGATNVYRTLGKKFGFLVLFIDVLKGAFAVYFLPRIFGLQIAYGSIEIAQMFVGTAAICGHIWTVFLDFKGGKGVAVTTGVLIVLAPKIILCAFLIWVLVFTFYKYVSLASIFAAASLPVLALIFFKPKSLVLYLLVIAFIGIYKHKDNIKR
ncbi:MAG: glycerol-3-phosphate 1-O-acyltransferase PlsY, partial [Candidatus Omnitrophica bacterium]|nr:glycerol-3-phosphate 1-O-acyltransferase PlsY [Candidatus Omnitrophota bacterium]